MKSLFRSLTSLTLLFAVAGSVGVVCAETSLEESPFLPPANAATPAKTATAYELAGMSVAGKATLLSIVRVKDKRSTWVAVGQTAGEITAVSYDPKTEQATIRADGKLITIAMKKASVVSASNTLFRSPFPSSAATPATAPRPVVTPLPATTQEEKETEARMLVTDLLEIGQQQRKAYEEAQRQAAAKSQKLAAPAGSGTRH
jgi:hypothetical protein